MAADGSIIIDTRIDTSDFVNLKQQFGGLASAAKKLGVAIGAAFSIGAIVRFGKESVNAASEMSNALRGLQSILEGQGRSFSAAQQFIEEYTKDGLIPATNAITAYKNLASRGYDDSQIRQVMVALKDASAFGRQASYSMGEAVQSATEGLKNENSVLVDNAGVTKNVAKMWDEYAASIGTTANNLTQQQKIQAEVNGILEESKYQAGDAAIVAGTFSGQLQQLAAAFNEIRVSVGQGLINALTPVIKVINTILAGLQTLAKAFAQFTSLLFGNAGGVAGGETEKELAGVTRGYEAAADAADDLADSTEAAGKAASKYLAGFDEIQKLGNESGGGGAAGGGSGAGVGDFDLGTIDAEMDLEDNISPKVEAMVEKIKALIAPLQEIDFTPLKTSLAGLGEAFGEFGGIILDNLEWAWSNILFPLATWTIEEGGPSSVDLLASAFEFLGAVLKPVYDGLHQLLKWLEPVFKYIGESTVETLKTFSRQFEKLTAVFERKGPEISGIISNIGEILAQVWSWIEPILSNMRDSWIQTFDILGDYTAVLVEYVIDTLYGLTEFIAGIFTGDWKRAWGGVERIFDDFKQACIDTLDIILRQFGTSWDELASLIKDAINGIIGSVNGLVSGIVSGINAAIKALNQISFEIPEWLEKVPGASAFAGKTFGFNIQTITAPQIPYLAKGAVIPPRSPFMAVLGDQKQGTNIEAPLSTIEEAVRNVLGERGEERFVIEFTGDLAYLGRVLRPVITKEGQRVGGSLVKGMETYG